jgi:hypothetical protein
MSSPLRQSRSPAPLTPADELLRMMREVTPLEDDEGSASGGRQMSSPSRGTASSQAEDVFSPSSAGPMRSIEQRAARRLADRLNLHPYQKEALNELVKVIPSLLCTTSC